jgi:hypothetical protein
MLSKHTFKGIKSKLCSVGVTLLLLGTAGMGFVRPVQASTMSQANANAASDFGRYRLPANMIHTFTRSLIYGQTVDVTVEGDGTTDLDVYVYDPYGRLVAKDDDDVDFCLVDFGARYTGAYTIKVVNRGSIYNDYDIEFDYE